jgi:hypothetical protein
MSLEFKEIPLESGEWINTPVEKDTIFLHHTAGNHRPDLTVSGWNKDRTGDGGKKRKRIATAFLIGGKSTRDGNTEWDGVIVRCFPEKEWAYHLGVKGTGGKLDKKSIGIEICNYGYLSKSSDGRFLTYVNSEVPKDQVAELEKPFRDRKYYHKYTDAQLESTGKLLRSLSGEYGIDLKLGLQQWIKRQDLTMPPGLSVLEQQKWLNQKGFVGANGKPLAEDGQTGGNTEYAIKSVGSNGFEYNVQALNGHGGLWTHTNVRKDKTDCSPQQALVDLILSF